MKVVKDKVLLRKPPLHNPGFWAQGAESARSDPPSMYVPHRSRLVSKALWPKPSKGCSKWSKGRRRVRQLCAMFARYGFLAPGNQASHAKRRHVNLIITIIIVAIISLVLRIFCVL